jgi:hypothetical protein
MMCDGYHYDKKSAPGIKAISQGEELEGAAGRGDGLRSILGYGGSGGVCDGMCQ